MALNTLEKVTLGISGLTAAAIGASILIAPHAFYASYGITLGGDASLLSELRAPAAGLAALGILMLWGIRKAALAPLAIGAALTVFLAFPAGRLVGLFVDGMPSDAILGALAFEVAVGALGLFAFRRRIGLSSSRPLVAG